MIPVPSGVRVWLAVGRTDMRKGMNGLALQVQQALGRDPHAGDLYVFRGARGDLLKIVWHDPAVIGDRAVLMAVPMAGQEFLTTISGFPEAQSLMIPSRIGAAQRVGGVIRSRWG